MAVSIPSDIVLEVAQARRPERYARVLERLRDGEATGSSERQPPQFSIALRNRSLLITNEMPAPRITLQSGASESATAFRKLEAQVIKHLIETILPASLAGGKATSTVNGYLKSTLADVLAQKVSDRGQIGLQERLQGAFNKNLAASKSSAAPTSS
jgi:hypothetical protein